MTNSTAILNHLQASSLLEVREWAKVLWVKVIVAGKTVCRFVSKKIGTTEMKEYDVRVNGVVQETIQGTEQEAVALFEKYASRGLPTSLCDASMEWRGNHYCMFVSQSNCSPDQRIALNESGIPVSTGLMADGTPRNVNLEKEIAKQLFASF